MSSSTSDCLVLTGTAWESSAWLRAAVATRLHQVGGLVDAGPVIIAPLTAPPPARRARGIWERSCDRCARYCPSDRKGFRTFVVATLGDRVRLIVGLCGRCADAELIPDTGEDLS